jgi:hypothetical protein
VSSLLDDAADLASVFAAAWNRERGQHEQADPVDMWPCCQILVESGLVVGQDEDLAAISIGPFRLALTRPDHQIRDFIEVLFPSTIAALPAGEPLTAAISSLLSAACLTFVKLADRGVFFGRSHEDEQRWTVLMHIINCNSNGSYPIICDVVTDVSTTTRWQIRPREVETAIDWLIKRELLTSPSPASPGLKSRV